MRVKKIDIFCVSVEAFLEDCDVSFFKAWQKLKLGPPTLRDRQTDTERDLNMVINKDNVEPTADELISKIESDARKVVLSLVKLVAI